VSKPLLPKSEATCLTITVVLVVPSDWMPDLGPIRMALEEALEKHAPDARFGHPQAVITAVTLPEVRE
jgi:hypothetical protein